MYKFSFLLLLVSSMSYANPINTDPFDKISCQASVQDTKVDLRKGSLLTYPPAPYLDGNHYNYDEKNNLKSQVNIWIRENEPGIMSVFFTLHSYSGEEEVRINLGGSKFKIDQGLDTWIGIPGTGTTENPLELHLVCR